MMKKYRGIMIAATTAAVLLSACSPKSDKKESSGPVPVTEKEKDNIPAEIQIPDDSGQPNPDAAQTAANGIGGQTGTGAGAAGGAATGAGKTGDSLGAADGAGTGVNTGAGAGAGTGLGTGLGGGTGTRTDAAGQTAGQAAGQAAALKETQAKKDYAVSAYDATMYATASVNVRSGCSTDSDVVAGLSAGEKVQVTGKSDNGWLRISYDGQEAYVYQKYLSDTAPKANSESKTAGSKAADGTDKASGSKKTGTTTPGTATQPGSAPNTPAVPGQAQEPATAPGSIPIVPPAPVAPDTGSQTPGAGAGPGQ